MAARTRILPLGRLTLAALAIVLSLGWAVIREGANQATAQGTPTVQPRNVGALGTVLTGANGMTLYTFDRDTPGVSNCNDQCANTWPPLTLDAGTPTAAAGVSGTLGVISRGDGRRQVTFNNQPLYFYSPDTQPGDTKGDGVGGVWHVVKVAATGAAAPAPAAQPAPGNLPRTGTGMVADRDLSGVWVVWGLALTSAVFGALAMRTRRRAEQRAGRG
jgi:predicted lipoprotein with Yx(FWY)xxD motif